MSVFKNIDDALDNDTKNKILQFGNLTIEKKVKKHSQQGLILIAKNSIGKKFAVKFYRPTDHDPEILKDGVKRFVREIRILASLNHKNIVNIYSGGKAIWDAKSNNWNISEGYDFEGIEEDELLFYIMDFIDGFDLSSLFHEEGGKQINTLEFQEVPLHEKLGLFETMISQVSSAMNYYHSKNITHKDIKPDNIRFSNIDSTFIIVDFGFAHAITSPQDLSSIPRTEYLDTPSIIEQNYELNDLGQFSRILLKIVPIFQDEYGTNRFEGIVSVLEKGKHQNLKLRYRSVLEFYNSLKPYFLTLPDWKFQYSMNEHLCSDRFGEFCYKLRIPVSGSILLSKEIRDIIDTKEFQRLRGIKQLGPTIFVYPGANGTRFEHSLGTYYLSLRFIEKLVKLPSFRNICEPIDETIKLIVLSSLLHDIGHYPYSHWIEEIDEFPRGITFPDHETRAKQMLCNETGEIHELIENQWGVSTDVVSNIISRQNIVDRDLVLNSFIDSVIDVDKIDYLIRDSIHCGVNYGKGIDLERLIDSLYINPNSKRLCLTDKGLSCLFSILTCRNIMYQEVYWHKTVRACDAMFKRFFYEYINNEIADFDVIINDMGYTDDYFIQTLYKNSKNSPSLNKLISAFAYNSRFVYKPLYIFSRTNASNEPIDTLNFCDKILKDSSFKHSIDVSLNLVEELKKEIPNLTPQDIIVEKTPLKSEHEVYELQRFKIWNLRKARFDDYPIEMNPMNEYLKNNRQAYIFCNPKFYKDLKNLIMNNKFDKILGKL